MTPQDQARDRLKNATWLADGPVQQLFSILSGEQSLTRAVGGAVRDTMLGRKIENPEIDFATELTPDEIERRAAAAGIAAIPTGKAFGTITLVIEGQTFEVTSLREDVETDGRHAIVRFGTDWQADAERRDFTMNALYADQSGRLFDPLSGLSDCLAAHVRFIGDPAARIREDGLRVHRFFRFTASHGGEEFDAVGLKACRDAAGNLSHLSAERVGAEMLKILALPRVAKTLATMSECAVVQLPDSALAALVRYESFAGDKLAVDRLALIEALMPSSDLQADWRLSNALIKQARARISAAKLLREKKFAAARFHFGPTADLAIPVAAALFDWSDSVRTNIQAALAAIPAASFPLTGKDLLAIGIKPGPGLGEMLEHLQEIWIDSGFELGRDALLAQARDQSQP